MSVSNTASSVLANRLFFSIRPLHGFLPVLNRLPTIGVSPYENPVAKIMAKVNILLTKLAAANSFVL